MTDQLDVNKNVSSKEGGVLTKLWRKILRDLGRVHAVPFMVDTYVAKSKNSVKAAKRKNKSSLIKNITAPEMTWKTFLDLMFEFMGAKRVEVIIKVTLPNGEIHAVNHIVESMVLSDEKVKPDEKTNEKGVKNDTGKH